MFATPLVGLGYEMTPDYNERTRVAEIRGYFQTTAGFLNGWMWWISMLPIFFVNGEASPVNGMRYLSIGIGILILILGVIPAIFVKERYYESDLVKNQKKVKLTTSLKETFSNKPFIILCLLTLFFLLGTSIFDSYGRFVGTYYVLDGDWNEGSKFAGYGTFIYMIFSFIFIPIFRSLSEKIGKPNVLLISIFLVLIAVSTTWWTFTPENPWLMLTNTAFIGAGYAGLWLMIPSMQVDVVDYDELKTGERREGSYASIFSWVLKLSFVIGFLISGPVIEMTGFDANLNANQKEGVYEIMRIGYIVIPVFSLIIAIILLRLFPITKHKASEIRFKLETRRGKI
jgi:GPH family glycoside/pentoside/hexuronide:cation symporter